MKKNIVFDFDDTLTTFDTIYPFFKFCNTNNFFIFNGKKLLWYFSLLIYRSKIISNKKLKEIGVRLFLNNLTPIEVQSLASKFYQKITYHKDVLKQYTSHINSTDNIIISSASFYEYLTIFSTQHENVKLSCSQLDYTNGLLKGIKFNNYGKNKLNYFIHANIKIDTLYTDSFSDKYLAQISNNIIVVTKQGKMIHFDSYEDFSNFFKKRGNHG